MRSSLDSFIQKTGESTAGKLTGGFGSLRGGRSAFIAPTNTTKCTNSGTCTKTNEGQCDNTGNCTGATNSQPDKCSNTGTCPTA